jgi:hypothetical protein
MRTADVMGSSALNPAGQRERAERTRTNVVATHSSRLSCSSSGNKSRRCTALAGNVTANATRNA